MANGLKGINTSNGNPTIDDYYNNILNAEQQQLKLPSRSVFNASTGNAIEYEGNKLSNFSKYDENIQQELTDANSSDLRSKEQPWYDKITAGTAKGVVLAGTTFVDTFAGTLAGIMTAATEGRISGLWDNPVTNALNDINTSMESILPNYYSKKEQENNENGEWYKNIFTANFLGDVLIKNAGFMVGAALAGKGVASLAQKALTLNKAREGFRGIGILGSNADDLAGFAEKATKMATGDVTIDGKMILDDAAKAARKLRSAPEKIKWIGATTGALGEARLQTVSDVNDFENKLQNQFEQSFPQIVQQEQLKFMKEHPEYVNSDGSLKSEGSLELNNILSKKYEDAQIKIQEDKLKYGNRDFFTNFALLASSDYVQFGRMYAGGFKNASRVANVSKEVGEDIYKASKPSLLKKAWTIAKTPLAEGPYEEMGQGAITRTLNEYYGSQYNSFLAHQIDPNSNQESVSWLNAIGEGLKQTYGTAAGWEDGFVGGIMGLIGMPSMVRTDINSETGKSSHKLIMNGSIGEVAELNKNYKEDLEIADALNKRVQDPTFKTYYEGLVRRNAFEADKQTALDNKDNFEYKNAEHSSLISDAIMFDKAGRIQDLYDTIDSYTNLSDDNIKEIRESLASQKDQEIPFQNKTDEELKSYIQEKAEKTKKDIDTYRKISDDVATKFGDTFKGESLAELTWMLTKVDNWENRFNEIHKNLLEDIKPLIPVLNNKTIQNSKGEEIPVTEVLNLSPTELLYNLTDEANAIHKKIKQTQNTAVKYRDLATTKIDEIVNTPDKKSLNSTLKRIDVLKKQVEKHKNKLAKANDIVEKINDLTRIAGARTAFLNKYVEYINNPESMAKDQEETIKESIKQQEANKEEEIKDKKEGTSNFTNYTEYRDYLNNLKAKDPTFNEVEFNNSLIKDNNEFAQQHKDLSKVALNVKNRIARQTNFSPEAQEVANIMFDNAIKESTDIGQLLNIDSKYLSRPTQMSNGELVTPELHSQGSALLRKVFELAKMDQATHRQVSQIPPQEGIPAQGFSLDTEPEIIQPSKDLPTVDSKVVENKPITEEKVVQTKEPHTQQTQLASNGIEYYYNPIPQFEVNTKTNGQLIPFKNRYPNYTEIYDYFTDKGTWNYLNSGKVHADDTVHFLIDPEFRNRQPYFKDVIFITHGPDNQIIGSLTEGKNAQRFKGLPELRARIEREFKENGQIQETGKIAQVNSGYLNYNKNKSRDLKGLPNLDSKNLIFGTKSHSKEFFLPNVNIDRSKVVEPTTPGMIVLYQKSGDGNYVYSPLSIKTFNPVEFNRNDVVTQSNPRFKRIDKAVDILASAETQEAVTKGYRMLSKTLLLGESMIQNDGQDVSPNKTILKINLSKDGNVLVISKREPDENGIQKETKVYKIYVTEKDELPGKKIGFNDQGEAVEYKPKRQDTEYIKEQIYNALYDSNLIFNIEALKLNEPKYNEEIYNGNLLTTNLIEGGTQGVWFYLQAKDNQGKEIPFTTPSKKANEIVDNIKREKNVNPVVKQESVIQGTPIAYKGENYTVDNGTVYDTQGKVVNNIQTKVVLDLAYIKDGVNGKFGPDFVKDHQINKHEWKVQNGVIFNIQTMEYKAKESTDKQTNRPSPSSPSLIQVDLDPNFMGSMGDVFTDFKNIEINPPKNQELSKKIPNFVDLPFKVKANLINKGYTVDKWNNLTEEEQEHALECAK